MAIERNNKSRKFFGRPILAGALGITGALLVGTMPAQAGFSGPTQVCSPGPTPSITVHDAEAHEVNQNASVEVTLSNKACWYVTVLYSTNSSSADEGDYATAVNQKLTFKPGQMSRSIMIPLVNDGAGEGPQQFFVTLSSPSGATVADGQAVVTIHDHLIPQ